MTDTKQEREALSRLGKAIAKVKKSERKLTRIEHRIERMNVDMATVREARAKVAEYRHSRMNA